MNVEQFQEAVNAIADNKGVSHQAIINALHDALQIAYTRYLHGGNDARVEVNIDEENGHVTIAQLKKVVEEVQDDYLEISKEDALIDAEDKIDSIKEDLSFMKSRNNASKKEEMKHLISLIEEEKKNLKVGEDYRVYCPFETLSKLTASSFRSVLTQKIAEAGHEVLYEIYKDHIGELVTGTVEAVSGSSVTVNIGKGTTELYKEDLIGDEDFKLGDIIKVYIEEVKQAKDDMGHGPKGPQIKATRSTEGFLKRLFEEEIHEIYDGTVVIKGIARRAGVRSKVAVASTNEDVDPIGACIGQGGTRIQKVVSQLGNSKYKEKIDIIPYSDYTPLYIAEAMRPANVLGVKIIDENSLPHPTAAVVIDDEQYAVAIGKRGSNATLANKLTGWNIRVYKKSDAEEEGLEYTPLEEVEKTAEELKKTKSREEYAKRSAEELANKANEPAEEVTPVVPEVNEDDVELEETPVTSEVAPTEEKVSTPVEETLTPVKEEVKVEETPVVKPVETTEVKTTKTLDELEKELSQSKDEKEDKKGAHKFGKSKRPHNISDNEVARVTPNEVPASEAMPIYSDEELAEIEQEENEIDQNDDDSIDYDDFDEYYDDNK